MTVTNEGKTARRLVLLQHRLHQLVPSLPDDTLYFHAQYRQAAPCATAKADRREAEPRRQGQLRLLRDARARPPDGRDARRGAERRRLDGRRRRHDLRRRRVQTRHRRHRHRKTISWAAGTSAGATARSVRPPSLRRAAHLMPERTGGRYCCYRWHGDNPVTFTRYLKHTHGARARQRPRRQLLFLSATGIRTSPTPISRALPRRSPTAFRA